ncbi:cytochrome c oxidase subunit 7A2-like, mitochondrial [Dermacentor variabilis]|uniref:cytochrome c oxidase subunit 7A2-like, mitochondrial n=1 Tax=Dermacentor variabilis TaxID=34621 RepID=UPI003F5B9D92
MNVARTLTTVARRAPQLKTTAVAPARKYRTLAQIKELQKQFCADDGVPVYLKRGKADVLLYQFTLVMTAATLGMCLFNTYRLIYRNAK